MLTLYILDADRTIRETNDPMEWSIAFEDIERRRVGFLKNDNCLVSTVFIGDGMTLFETLVRTGNGEKIIDKYDTYQEALEGHERIVKTLDSHQDR